MNLKQILGNEKHMSANALVDLGKKLTAASPPNTTVSFPGAMAELRFRKGIPTPDAPPQLVNSSGFPVSNAPYNPSMYRVAGTDTIGENMGGNIWVEYNDKC